MTDPSSQDIFERDIAPTLAEVETRRLAALAERKARWNKVITFGLIPIAIAIGVLALIFQFKTGSIVLISILALAVIAFGGWLYASGPTDEYENDLRQSFMTAACKAIGDISYQRNHINNFSLDPFRSVRLLPSFDDNTLEDLLEGAHRNCRFSLVEAKLTDDYYDSDNDRKTREVFKGLLIRIEVPFPIEGQILIAKDMGSFINQMSGAFKPGTKVEIPHQSFEQKYEVYATVPEEALHIISPSFVENFLRLPAIVGSDKITAAFRGNEFLLSAKSSKPFLEGFTASKETTELKQLFQELVKEASLVRKIIDQLHEAHDK